MKNERRAAELLATPPTGWMETLGARISESEPGRVVLELEAGPKHRHGGGIVQGGVITQIADAAMGMSLATLQEDGLWNTTIELKINLIGTTRSGIVECEATLVHGGRSTQVWDARIIEAGGRTIALFRCTQMLLYRTKRESDAESAKGA